MKTIIIFIIFQFLVLSSPFAQPCIPNTNSLDFNGSNSFVRINSLNGLEITASLTIEAWIFPKQFATSSTGNSILCKHSWGSSMYGYVLRCGGNGILSFNLAGAVGGSPVGWQEVLSFPGALVLNTWQHVAGTFDGSAMNVYVNGSLAGSYAFTGTIYPSTGYKARIGALSDTTWSISRYFNGMIDEVRIWDRALSQAEIQSGMNDHIDPALQSGLVGYYRLNEGSGPAVGDLGAGNNNGTMLAATWVNQVPFNNNSLPLPVITYISPNLVSSYTDGNQWYLGTVLIPGATQQTYTPVQYGLYKVMVTDTNGCTAISLPFNFNTAGLEAGRDIDFTLFPNPARGKIAVIIPEDRKPLGFSITPVTGEISVSRQWETDSDGLFDVSGLSPGLYIVRIQTSKGDLLKKLLIY